MITRTTTERNSTSRYLEIYPLPCHILRVCTDSGCSMPQGFGVPGSYRFVPARTGAGIVRCIMGRKSYSSRTETRALERGTKPSSYAERTTAQKVLAFALALILTVESLFNNGVSTAFAETLAEGLGNQPGTEQADGNVDGQRDNNTDPDDPTDLNDPENTTEPGDPKDPSDSSDPTDPNKGSESSDTEEGDEDTIISDPNKDETPDPNTTTETEAETSAETSDPNKTDTSDSVETETPDPNTTETETPDPNTTETETPDPNTATETDADPVEVETWDWTGKTDNLTLSSPDGLAFDTEVLKAIVEEAQATADSSDDETEADAGDETEADSEDTTDQTDNTTDQTENDQTTPSGGHDHFRPDGRQRQAFLRHLPVGRRGQPHHP